MNADAISWALAQKNGLEGNVRLVFVVLASFADEDGYVRADMSDVVGLANMPGWSVREALTIMSERRVVTVRGFLPLDLVLEGFKGKGQAA